MDVEALDRGFSRSAFLRGTASVLYRDERKTAPSLPADQSKTVNQKYEKRRRGRLMKALVNKCFPCICRKSESYTPEETSASNVDRGVQNSAIHRCTQDYEKDAHFKHLIPNTGRSHCYPVVSAESINVSVRSAVDELNTVGDQGGQHETLPKVQSTTDGMTSAGVHVPDTAETKSLSYHHSHSEYLVPGETSEGNVQGVAKQIQVVSENQANKDVGSNANDNDAGTRRKSVDTDRQRANGSVVVDLKSVLGAVSAQMNQAFGQENHARPSVRERSLYMRQQKLRVFQPKELLVFRHPPTLRPYIQMMKSSSNETQRSERREEGAQASSVESGIHFSIPVQVTDDQPSLPPDIGYQGIVPNSQWEMEASGVTGSQTLNPAYYASLVTNSTQWIPEQSSGRERAGDSRQSGQATEGQLSMRGNALNPLGAAAHNHRDHVVEHNLEPLPYDFVPEFDQLNMDGSSQVSHRPHFSQFGLPTLRLPTFQQGWPTDHSQSACSLVDAGFFYGGYGDSVLCYSCGIGLRHWLAEDDPWVEHARLRPSCVLVKNVQGQEFIDVAREMTRSGRKPTYQQVRLEANRRRQAAQAGNRGDDVESALNYDDATTVELLCKICYRRERNVMLNPCQHIAVCEPCALLILSCPTCRAHVQTFQALM